MSVEPLIVQSSLHVKAYRRSLNLHNVAQALNCPRVPKLLAVLA